MPQHCDGSSDCAEPSEDPSTRKLQLEIKKLEAETQHISQQTSKRAEVRRSIVTLGAVLSSLALIATLLFSILDYSDQRRANREFEVTQEIVSLTLQLSSESALTKRTAALLLASPSYGDKTVDLLTSSLFAADRGLSAQLILSLKKVSDIGAKEHETVGYSLIRQAQISFCESNYKSPNTAPLYNYLRAIGQILAKPPSSTIEEELIRFATLFRDARHLRDDEALFTDFVDTLSEFIGNRAETIVQGDPDHGSTICRTIIGDTPT